MDESKYGYEVRATRIYDKDTVLAVFDDDHLNRLRMLRQGDLVKICGEIRRLGTIGDRTHAVLSGYKISNVKHDS